MRGIRIASEDDTVGRSLIQSCEYFCGVLGAPKSHEERTLVFSQCDPTPLELRAFYRIDTKFLARIYLLVIEATFSTKEAPGEGERAELWQSGFFSKGTPRFRKKKGGSPETELLPGLLNRDEAILATCKELDLEALRVFHDAAAATWHIQIQPYGGSFIWASFPPMRYRVALPDQQAKAILRVATDIAHAVKLRWAGDGLSSVTSLERPPARMEVGDAGCV